MTESKDIPLSPLNSAATAISNEFHTSVMTELEQIRNLILASSRSLIFFRTSFESIADSLEELGNNELNNNVKQSIQLFISKKLPHKLYEYFRVNFADDNDYTKKYSYEFRKILYKLDLKTQNNLTLSQERAECIIYELNEIIDVLTFVKKQPVGIYDPSYLFLGYFYEINILLHMIKADKLEQRYKRKIMELCDKILSLVAESAKIYPKIHGMEVLETMREQFSPIAKKKDLKPRQARTDDKKKMRQPSAARSSFGSIDKILGNNHPDREGALRGEQISSIISALICIKELIPNPTEVPFSKTKVDLLRIQFNVIKSALEVLDKSDLAGKESYISQLLEDIRLIISQREFDKFYEDIEMTTIFSDLEFQCIRHSERTKKLQLEHAGQIAQAVRCIKTLITTYSKIDIIALQKQFDIIKISLVILNKLDLAGYEKLIYNDLTELSLTDQTKLDEVFSNDGVKEIFLALKDKCAPHKSSIKDKKDYNSPTLLEISRAVNSLNKGVTADVQLELQQNSYDSLRLG